MAKVLMESGFITEAFEPMRDAVETALQALMIWQGHDNQTPPDLKLIDSLLVQRQLITADSLSLISGLRKDESAWDEAQGLKLLAHGDRFVSQTASLLEPP
jgi:hypothetical protein